MVISQTPAFASPQPPENHSNDVIPAQAGIYFVRNVDPRWRVGNKKDFHVLEWAEGPWKLPRSTVAASLLRQMAM